MKPIIKNGRYWLKSKLGEGGFDRVDEGCDIKSGEEVAINLVHRSDGPRILEDEASIYRALAGGPGIPRVFWYGQQDDVFVLVKEVLGPSLENLFNFCGRHFLLKTVLLIADQAISRIKYIHDKHYLHHDVKPDNFLMEVGRRGNITYAIDLGLAQEFSGLASEGHSHGRTLRYASINNHNRRKQSWGDDLESPGYVLLYFIRGSLPWQGRKAANEEEKNDLIKEVKTDITTNTLCEALPEEFATYLDYVRSG